MAQDDEIFFDNYGINASISSGEKRNDGKHLITVTQKVKSWKELATIALGTLAAAASIVGLTVLLGAAEAGTVGAATPVTIPAYLTAVASIIAFFGLDDLFSNSGPRKTDCLL